VARETMTELRAGRPVQLLVTDLPRIKFNHSVLPYGRRGGGGLHRLRSQRSAAPGVVRFDLRDERFHPAPLCGVSVPSFRAFRQYYSPVF
jgi:hypothetical protein